MCQNQFLFVQFLQPGAMALLNRSLFCCTLSFPPPPTLDCSSPPPLCADQGCDEETDKWLDGFAESSLATSCEASSLCSSVSIASEEATRRSCSASCICSSCCEKMKFRSSSFPMLDHGSLSRRGRDACAVAKDSRCRCSSIFLRTSPLRQSQRSIVQLSVGVR